MGSVNKLSTKLEASNDNESAVTTTNDLAARAGNNLRIIAIKDTTYNDLREFAFRYGSHPTFDTIIRKLLDIANKKK